MPPGSFHTQIAPIMLILEHEKPKSILDIGCGNGKYGVLCREYFPDLERLDAVEAWEPYLTGVHRTVYDKIYIDNILTMKLEREYDAYLLIDVIEHMTIQEGANLVNSLPNKKVVATPRAWNPQTAEEGNEYQVHKSLWTMEIFANSFPGCAVIEAPASWVAVIPYDSDYLHVKKVIQ